MYRADSALTEEERAEKVKRLRTLADEVDWARPEGNRFDCTGRRSGDVFRQEADALERGASVSFHFCMEPCVEVTVYGSEEMALDFDAWRRENCHGSSGGGSTSLGTSWMTYRFSVTDAVKAVVWLRDHGAEGQPDQKALSAAVDTSRRVEREG